MKTSEYYTKSEKEEPCIDCKHYSVGFSEMPCFACFITHFESKGATP